MIDIQRINELAKKSKTVGLTDEEKENLWVQRTPQDPDTEAKYNRAELERLGAFNNYKWIQKPLIWAQPRGEVKSLTAGSTLGE